MFNFNEYVPASTIWATAVDHEDRGFIRGLVRGWNIEVTTREGKTDWLSACYFEEDPNNYFNDEFHQWMYNEHGFTPTGRICFRGYGIEEWCEEEREYFITPINDEDIDNYIEAETNEEEEW